MIKENIEEVKEYDYENYKKDIVSKIAYLIGVKDCIIKSDKFEQEIINDLEKNENATKIRALSIIRTDYIRNFKEITIRRNNLEPLETLVDLVSVDLIKYLRGKNIETNYANMNMSYQIAMINQVILDNIDSIKELIPSWVKWEYIKSIFLMPECYAGPRGSQLQNSNQAKKIVASINKVRKQIGIYSSFFPYSAYLNWPYEKIKPYYGNILFNDEKFLKILYTAFNDTFHANEYVIDATEEDKASIYDFIDKSNNIAILVDCENVDPYRFVSVFKNLEEDNIKKIKKVILYDDINTSNAWDYVNELIHLPIEHKMIERVLDNKSLVDIAMATGACKEYYQENTESIILASSDSDFFGLIRSLPNMRYYILNESDKTSNIILDKLEEKNIDYCFMDSFAQAEVQEFKNSVLLHNLRTKINSFNETGVFPILNPRELVDQIFKECFVQGSHYQIEAEKEAFYNKFIKKGFRISIEGKGDSSRFVLDLASTK